MNILRSITSGLTDEIFNCLAAISIVTGGYAQQSQEIRETGRTQVMVVAMKVIVKKSWDKRRTIRKAIAKRRSKAVTAKEYYQAQLRHEPVRQTLIMYGKWSLN